VWTGETFLVDGRTERVLSYERSPSGWTDELTDLIEATGGSDHFIDAASRRFALSEMQRCLTRTPSTILEVGCSSGFLLADIRSTLPQHVLVGSDYTGRTLQSLAPRVPGTPLLQFDLTRCPLPDNFADVVALLNVLEHVGDHEAAIRHLYRIARPGGVVIFEIPSGVSLYDVFDRVLMHHRRYRMSEFVVLLERAGFIVERRSHLGFFIYPAFYLTKRLNQWRYPEGSGLDERKAVARMMSMTRKSSPLMNLVMRLEDKLRRFVYLPFGVRCVVTCRKPAASQVNPTAPC
jgi:SAM-dependent methyltransferase